MKRTGLVVLLALGAGGCVSGDSASSGAVRVLHAVADAPRMSLYVDDKLKAGNFDYRSGSTYLAYPAGEYDLRLAERLPPDGDPDNDPDERTIFNAPVSFGVNDEVTLVVVGSAASQTEEVLQIPTRTRGVPTGKTRLQVVHASTGTAPVDVYVIDEDALVTASTPFAAGLAYKAWTPQSDITGGDARIVVTAAGNPAAVLLDTGPLFLVLEGTMLVAVVANTGLEAAEHPLSLTMLTGTAAGSVFDQDTRANLRVVNASPGSYAIDAFLNETSVDDTARQACVPPAPDGDTLLAKCALTYGTVGAYDALDPGNYDLKLQQADPATVTARSFVVGPGPGAEQTTLVTGLIEATDTTTDVTLQSFAGTRRVATAAQLRLVDVSLAGDVAVAGDPTTDRLEIYVTPACASLVDEDPDFTGMLKGADTGYVSYTAGDYQVTIAESDTATPDAAPVVLLSRRVTLAAGGVYALAIADSVGGVQPLQYLSLDDDPALADCPAPP